MCVCVCLHVCMYVCVCVCVCVCDCCHVVLSNEIQHAPVSPELILHTLNKNAQILNMEYGKCLLHEHPQADFLVKAA